MTAVAACFLAYRRGLVKSQATGVKRDFAKRAFVLRLKATISEYVKPELICDIEARLSSEHKSEASNASRVEAPVITGAKRKNLASGPEPTLANCTRFLKVYLNDPLDHCPSESIRKRPRLQEEYHNFTATCEL